MQQPPPPISANGVVESLMESFCQCFGTESHLTTSQRHTDEDDVIAAPSTPPRNGKDTGSAPSTPEMKPNRPTNHLFTLQQRGKAQWNSFFFGPQTAPTTPQVSSRYDSSNMTNIVTPPQPEFTSSTLTATSRRNRSKAHSGHVTSTMSNELKSRSSSKSSSPKSQQNRKSMTKRKRPASRDDIFRSKRDQQQQFARQQHSSQFNNTNPNSSSNFNSGNNMNPFLSRFLSGSSPVCMATLCFATPIRGDSSFEDNELNNNTIGDDDDDDDAASSSNNNSTNNHNGKNINNGNHNDVASVVSDSNTLNTAEDTITSTLYYETTKLAGLKQTNPLMPLYNSHAVGHAKDDIHQIVHLRSQQQQQQQQQHLHHNSDRLQQPLILTNRIPPQQYVPSIPPPQQLLQENNMDDDDDEDDDDDVEEDGIDEQMHIYISNEGQRTKQQLPLTPPKKAGVVSDSSAAHHYSPVRIIAGLGHHRLSPNRVSTPNQSPLPPVSKLSSDSSKS